MTARRQMRLTEVGWDKDLELTQSDEPAADPAGDQVRIAVEACGVCYRDCVDRSGRFPFMQVPITPGHEVVGRVVAVGPKVTDWTIGDRVAGMHRDFCGDCPPCKRGETSLCLAAAAIPGLLIDGGYSSEMVAPERCFFAVPDAIDAAEAAVMHCTYGTAFRGLNAAGVAAGARVLVTGANGGVGTAAIQVARRRGADVTAVIRDESHADALRALGAEEVIVDGGDRFHKKLPGAPVDAVLDCVGPPTFNSSLRSLLPGGCLVVIGNIVQERVSLNLGHVITKSLRLVGSSGATRNDMAQVLQLHVDQPFDVPVHAKLPLEEADRAQRQLKAGGVRGRMVLLP